MTSMHPAFAQLIDAGANHTVYRCTDGTLWGVGEGGNGQLGDGQFVNHTAPVQATGITNVRMVSGGQAHTLVLGDDGLVRVTGRNVEGQLGNAGINFQLTYSILPGHTDVKAISCGRVHSLILKNDGTVWAFGSNTNGQLGTGNTTNSNVPVQIPGLSDIIAISAGRIHSLFLKSDGTVWACGSNNFGQVGNTPLNPAVDPVQISGLSDIKAIDAGDNHSLFLHREGFVLACGYNQSGQLGNGNTQSTGTVVSVNGMNDVIALGARGNHSLFLKSDGTAWGCGANAEGQLGDGTNTNRTTPVQVQGISDVVALAAGGNHSIFLRNDGTLWACGWNVIGQLGDGTTTTRNTVAQVNTPCIICYHTYASLSVTACNSYTTPSGNATYTTSGIYEDIIPNAMGCDSITVIDLQILEADLTLTTEEGSITVGQTDASYQWLDCGAGNIAIEEAIDQDYSPTTSGTYAVEVTVDGCTTTSACVLFCLPATGAMSVTACDSYTTPSGSATYTTSGTYLDTVLTALGCDSVLTIELAILNSTASIESHMACDSFIWIDGNTYTESNNAATIVLTNAAGCDSLITLDLTILNSTASIGSHIACDSFTWIDGNTYTASNSTATVLFTNAVGCDSLVTLDLTILNATSGIDVQTACDSFTWIDGNTYTASNSSATYLLTNAAGCDSTVTLDLNIIAIDTTVTVDGVTLTANAENAQYQWLDCDNALAPIEGASGQSFTPSENGSYAVEITADGCTSISACQLVLSTGVLENTFGVLRVHPNPTTGHVQVALGEVYGQVDAVVRDARGCIVMERSATRTSMLQFEIAGDAGLYLLELRAGSSHAAVRLMKE